ncbi:MAG: hypothetical protein ACI9SI_000968 [Polaribacter sp.]|jgi:hypothetical protein
MKTIQILRTLINILFYTLIAVFSIGFVFLFLLYFFPESLPTYLGNFSMLFNQYFGWKMYLVPISTIINYTLLIIAMYFLRKSVASFLNSNFYSENVTRNLKKAGNIFVFIGVSSIIIQLFAVLHIQSIANNLVQMETNFFTSLINILAASIDLKSILAIIIGLFFLLFSTIFENSRTLKQENDLTI